MKATIKVPVTTTQEVEVQLPQFRKDNKEYYAFYGEKMYDNIYFRVENSSIITFMAFSDISNVTKGDKIEKSEFINAFNEAKENINLYGVDAKGEYYVEEELTDSDKQAYYHEEHKKRLSNELNQQ